MQANVSVTRPKVRFTWSVDPNEKYSFIYLYTVLVFSFIGAFILLYFSSIHFSIDQMRCSITFIIMIFFLFRICAFVL